MILSAVLIFTFCTFFGWAFGDLFATINSRALGSLSAGLWRILLSILYYTLLLPFLPVSLQGITKDTILIFVLLLLIGAGGTLCFYEGLRRGKAAVTGVIASSFSIIVVLLSLGVYGEHPSGIAWAGIIAIFGGIVLASTNLKTLEYGLFHDRGVPWAIGAMVLWGIYFTFIKIPAVRMGPFLTSYLYALGFLPILILLMRIRKEPFHVPKTRGIWGSIIGHSVAITLAEIGYNMAAVRGAVSVIAPIASSYPVLFSVLSFYFLKEKLDRQQLIGVMIGLGGIVTMAVWG